MESRAEPVRWTYDDLLRLPDDDGLRHELIDGVHVVSPSPSVTHQQVIVNLVLLLGPLVRERKLGRLFVAPLDTVLSKYDVVEPDLLFVSRQRSEILERPPHVQGTPDLVVEVLSPSTRRRDLGVKRDLYERAGVVEYWIVDPEERTIEPLRRRRGRLVRGERLAEAAGDRLTSRLLPGLEIALAEIFRN